MERSHSPLYLDESILSVALNDGLHELVDEVIIRLARHSLVLQTDIERIVQELLVVGADVQDDGETLVGLDAGQGSVEGQLPDGDAHAVGAQVSQAEDALSVRDDDGADVLFRPIPEHAVDVALVVDGDEEAAGAAVDDAKLLAGQPDRGGVDDGHHVLHVLREDPVKETLVTILEPHEVDVLVEILRVALEVDEAELHLLRLGLETGRNKAVEAESLTLCQGESHALDGNKKPILRDPARRTFRGQLGFHLVKTGIPDEINAADHGRADIVVAPVLEVAAVEDSLAESVHCGVAFGHVATRRSE